MKHIKGIMGKKGYTFLGCMSGSSLHKICKRATISSSSKFMIFKPAKAGYVFISKRKIGGVYMVIYTSPMVYYRPKRGGGYKPISYRTCCRRISTVHTLHSMF